ncbi:plasma membrane ATPase 1-like [Dorcoceras hygrometricum]|uniref:Plasma membrane ATPase 1-like n=1 Tax=Dorcoceras hygrometricum TaxID=472368 RepID=A0A2Z7CV09_9LAMI|nr:plasma membrane ATPase 1-like [Dorcoceras hygrometricum]
MYQPGKSSVRDLRGPSAHHSSVVFRNDTQSLITPMIALDLSGTTHQSSGHNVALNQIDSDLVIYRTTLVRTFQVSTRSVLGKCVYLVTLAMSLFNLQDVCIAIGSIATLDLPMVVDLIWIYGLKGPYRTLTTTNWFLQALSMIPRGSWGDVARRSYHDPMGKSGIVIPEPQCRRRRAPPPPPLFAGKLFPANLDEENPSAPISSVLLVQADEGVSHLIMDRIDIAYRNLLIETKENRRRIGHGAAAHGGAPYSSPCARARVTPARWPRMARDVGRCPMRWLVFAHRLRDVLAGRFACDDGRRLVTSWPHDCAHGGARLQWMLLHVDSCWALWRDGGRPTVRAIGPRCQRGRRASRGRAWPLRRARNFMEAAAGRPPPGESPAMS